MVINKPAHLILCVTLHPELIEYFMNEGGSNGCELCGSTADLSQYTVPPGDHSGGEQQMVVCSRCLLQMEKREELDPAHWRGLTTTMWSDSAAVQVTAWRMLHRLKNESWAAEALDVLYLDDDLLEWAKATNDHLESDGDDVHRDVNGMMLQQGDSVVLVKTLEVKGSQVQAKIGTVVKNIKPVSDNTGQIEGKIEGQQIVILTKYVRKQS